MSPPSNSSFDADTVKYIQNFYKRVFKTSSLSPSDGALLQSKLYKLCCCLFNTRVYSVAHYEPLHSSNIGQDTYTYQPENDIQTASRILINSTFAKNPHLGKIKRDEHNNRTSSVIAASSTLRSSSNYDELFTLTPGSTFYGPTKNKCYTSPNLVSCVSRRAKLANRQINHKLYVVKVTTHSYEVRFKFKYLKLELKNHLKGFFNEFEITKKVYPETYCSLAIDIFTNNGFPSLKLKTYLFTPHINTITSLPQKVDSWLEIFVKIAAQLEKIHDENILHLDLKPENIVISKSRDVFIIDFGLSESSVIKDYFLPATTGTRGTYGYIAPEIRLCGFSVRADIFSYGVTLRTYLNSAQVHVGHHIFRTRFDRFRPNQLKLIHSKNQSKLIDCADESELISLMHPHIKNYKFIFHFAFNLISRKVPYFITYDADKKDEIANCLAKILMLHSIAQNEMCIDYEKRLTVSEIQTKITAVKESFIRFSALSFREKIGYVYRNMHAPTRYKEDILLNINNLIIASIDLKDPLFYSNLQDTFTMDDKGTLAMYRELCEEENTSTSWARKSYQLGSQYIELVIFNTRKLSYFQQYKQVANKLSKANTLDKRITTKYRTEYISNRALIMFLYQLAYEIGQTTTIPDTPLLFSNARKYLGDVGKNIEKKVDFPL